MSKQSTPTARGRVPSAGCNFTGLRKDGSGVEIGVSSTGRQRRVAQIVVAICALNSDSTRAGRRGCASLAIEAFRQALRIKPEAAFVWYYVGGNCTGSAAALEQNCQWLFMAGSVSSPS